jgi:predicted PolB exonuclease-like 3'-5' exonuclease
MAVPYLLLELALRPRADFPASASTGYRLVAVYAIEIDDQGRRQRSHRLAVAEACSTAELQAEILDTELQLLERALAHIEAADCLVTARGRQLEIPVLEALSVRYGLTLKGHFPVLDPYSARRSPYNPAGHLDLTFFLADGDRRLRSLSSDLLFRLTFPAVEALAGAVAEGDSLEAARDRSLQSYLLFLRIQELRGKLDSDQVRRRKAELGSGLSPKSQALARQSERLPPVNVAPTWLDAEGEGFLAFDIETVVDVAAIARCAGLPVTGMAEAMRTLSELLQTPVDFAPAPFHRVVALAMVYWDGIEGPSPRVELERLVLGSRSRLGAPIEDESAILSAFWRDAAGKRLLSYNGKRFDLPVLLYRSLPYSIGAGWYLEEHKPPYEQYRHRRSLRQLDVFEELSGGLSPGRLGDLLQTVGLPGKQGIAGGDIEELWSQERMQDIGDYCLSDAAQTFLLAVRFMSVAGHVERSRAGAAISAARSRFEQEPALQRMLAASTRFFEGS